MMDSIGPGIAIFETRDAMGRAAAADVNIKIGTGQFVIAAGIKYLISKIDVLMFCTESVQYFLETTHALVLDTVVQVEYGYFDGLFVYAHSYIPFKVCEVM